MTVPSYRKRQPSEAITVTAARRDLKRLGELPDLPGGSVRAKLEAAGSAAVDVMYDLLRYGESREQAEASRVLLAAWMGSAKIPEGSTAGGPPTGADRAAVVTYLRGCLRNPDAELLEALRAERDAVMASLGDE